MTDPTSADSLVVSAATGAAVALAVTMLVVPITIRLARRRGIVDEPGARSSHTIATPRLGGIAVGVGALAGLAGAACLDPAALRTESGATLRLGLVLGATALLFGLIGLLDDLMRGIPVSARLIGQVVVGAALVAPWTASELGWTTSLDDWAVRALGVVAAAWIIGYVNAFNFMDGVDGMSGLVSIVVGLDLALVGALDDHAALVVAGLVLAGAAAGFLRFNLRPGTVFLGDGGSYFMGAWIAIAVVIGIVLHTPPEAVMAVTAPYLADTATTLVRRIARHANWRDSHHEHTYQRLIEQGRSHRAVAVRVGAVSAVCGGLGLVSLKAGPGLRVVAALAVVAVAAAYVLAPSWPTGRRAASATGRSLDVPR